MATAIIYVFSGTKNTLVTAGMIKAHLESNQIDTFIYEIKKPFESFPMPGSYDYVGFGYPVHAFNCPQMFLQFVKRLPQQAGKKAFIFKTSGEPFKLNDVSSYKLYRLLAKKNYEIVLEHHMLMPYNIMFRYQDSLAKQMYLYSNALCHQLVLKLLSGEKQLFKFHLRHRIISTIFRVQWSGAKLNGRLYTVNHKRCNLCMRCVYSCPSNNISLKKGKLKFDFSCAMCMRCAMFCPTNAVNIGILRFWKVNGAYNFNKILSNPDIAADFINPKTKGYFRLFKKFFENADRSLAAYGIKIPQKYSGKETHTVEHYNIKKSCLK
ncbi:MAG: EFR1 family ferrodoxin [Christensenellales bacterium]